MEVKQKNTDMERHTRKEKTNSDSESKKEGGQYPEQIHENPQVVS